MTYSAEAQAAVAAEMQDAQDGAVWPGWMVDYGRMRAAVRACVN